MPKTNFLKKLYREKKLEIVKPSEDIKEGYLEKSDSNLDSAKLLYENGKLEEAVSMAYYSMYNSVIALLFKIGVKCENHSASIRLLKKLFDIDNSSIIEAKTERIDTQYYLDFEITKEDVKSLIKNTEEFTSMMYDFISKVTNEDVTNYRRKLKELLE